MPFDDESSSDLTVADLADSFHCGLLARNDDLEIVCICNRSSLELGEAAGSTGRMRTRHGSEADGDEPNEHRRERTTHRNPRIS